MTDLWQLLAEHDRLNTIWSAEHTEETRLAMRRCWDIGITQPGARMGAPSPLQGDFTRCTPTILNADHDRGCPCCPEEARGLYYRGACLGCGWVADVWYEMRDHDEWGGGEKRAVFDAHDHAFPGWRNLPIVDRYPDGASGGSPKDVTKAQQRWHDRFDHLFPRDWFERGGPIQTAREGMGTRDVPGCAPGGGYDIGIVVFAPRQEALF